MRACMCVCVLGGSYGCNRSVWQLNRCVCVCVCVCVWGSCGYNTAAKQECVGGVVGVWGCLCVCDSRLEVGMGRSSVCGGHVLGMVELVKGIKEFKFHILYNTIQYCRVLDHAV